MPSYPDPEGPEEVPTHLLATDVKAELLLKDPTSWREESDGTKTMFAPPISWLEWSAVPLVRDPDECYHAYTVCAECADSWGTDYFMRFSQNGHVVWTSPDHPGSDDEGNPPIYNIN